MTTDRLFALAEPSFLYAERSSNRPQYVASAAYAYAYLFPGADAAPDPLHPRVRLSEDLYDASWAEGGGLAAGSRSLGAFRKLR